MTRTRRILRWSAWALVALLVILPLLWMTAVPWLVHRRVISALHDAGFPDADLTVAAVSLSSATLTDVKLDHADRLRLGTVTARYSPGSLWHGRLRELDVNGAQWVIRVRDGIIDLGLPSLPKSRGPSSGAGDLPLDQLNLQASSLTIDWNGNAITLPMEARVTRPSSGIQQMTLNVSAFGVPVNLGAEFKPAQAAAVRSPTAKALMSTINVGSVHFRIVGTIDTAESSVDLSIDSSSDSFLQIRGGLERLALPEGSTRLNLAVNCPKLDDMFRAASPQTEPVVLSLLVQHVPGAEVPTQMTGEITGLNNPSGLVREDKFTARFNRRDGLWFGIETSGEFEGLAFNIDASSDCSTDQPPGVNFRVSAEGMLPAILNILLVRQGITVAASSRIKFGMGGRLERGSGARNATSQWRFDVDSASVRGQSDQIVVAAVGLALTKASFSAGLDGFVTAGAGELRIAQLRASAEGVTDLKERLQISRGGRGSYRGPANGVSLYGMRKPLTLTFDPSSPASRWRIEIPELQLIQSESTLGLKPYDLRLWGIAMETNINGFMSAAKTDLSVEYRLIEPVEIESSEGSGKFEGNGLLRLLSTKEETWSLQGSMNIKLTDIQTTRWPIQAQNIVGTVPFSLGLGDEGADLGTVTFEGVEIGGSKLGVITAHVAVSDKAVRFDAGVPVTDQSTVSAVGDIRLSAGQNGSLLTVSLPKTSIEQMTLFRALVPAIAEYELSGGVAAEASIAFDGGQLKPNLRIDLDGVSIKNIDRDMGAEGISGSIVIDGLSPLHTPPSQVLTIKSAHSRELGLIDGTVAFRAESTGTLFVEKTLWHTKQGGTLQAHAVRVGTQETGVDFDLFIEDLNVAEWISLFTDESVEAEGRLYGKLPVRYSWGPEPGIKLGEGFLYAKPGTTGWVKIKSKGVVERAIDQAGVFNVAQITDEVQRQVQQQLRDMVISALTNYEFNVLTFDFVHEEGKAGILCRMKTSGKGREGEKPIPIADLTVNLRGIESLLNLRLLGIR